LRHDWRFWRALAEAPLADFSRDPPDRGTQLVMRRVNPVHPALIAIPVVIGVGAVIYFVTRDDEKPAVKPKLTLPGIPKTSKPPRAKVPPPRAKVPTPTPKDWGAPVHVAPAIPRIEQEVPSTGIAFPPVISLGVARGLFRNLGYPMSEAGFLEPIKYEPDSAQVARFQADWNTLVSAIDDEKITAGPMLDNVRGALNVFSMQFMNGLPAQDDVEGNATLNALRIASLVDQNSPLDGAWQQLVTAAEA
jgi:hypothetical protein